MNSDNIEEQIKAAATKIIRDEIESSSDYLPWRFKINCIGVYHGMIQIIGPKSAPDDILVVGVYINTYLVIGAHVHINPFPEINRSCTFEYSDPEFPDNLFRYVKQGMSDWLYWWDIFKQCYTTES